MSKVECTSCTVRLLCVQMGKKERRSAVTASYCKFARFEHHAVTPSWQMKQRSNMCVCLMPLPADCATVQVTTCESCRLKTAHIRWLCWTLIVGLVIKYPICAFYICRQKSLYLCWSYRCLQHLFTCIYPSMQPST